MSRIANSQSAEACWSYLEYLIPKIPADKQGIGITFVYGDWLYLYSNEPAVQLRTKFLGQIQDFKNRLQGLLRKHPWYIPSAFSHMTWLEVLLQGNDFPARFGELKRIYEQDVFYQDLVRQDIVDQKRDPNDQNNISFILEETLLLYFISKGKIHLRNDYIHGQERWILSCYPGKPLRAEAYLYEQNFFKLTCPTNKYENGFYDLAEKKLYTFGKTTNIARAPEMSESLKQST
jgi:hypothetical protein